MSDAGIVVRTGRKWRAAEAVQQAETRLKHKAILGTMAQGRAGLCQRKGEVEAGTCPPKSIQPVHMGQNRNTCMPPLFQSRDIRTHHEQLLQGAG